MGAAPTPTTPPARPRAGITLAGAHSRLLPPSIPFRFFGTAVVCHVLAWLALAAGAADWPHWRGGLGWPLAALHLMTVGTLLGSGIGASLQLLPVATQQPLRSHRLAGLLWWLHAPGVVLLAAGMGWSQPPLLAAGAALLAIVLVLYAGLLVPNLRAARGMPGVVLHGWAALAGLALLLGSAAVLVALWLGHALLPRDIVRPLHALAGLFGVMGLLAFGLSYILLPMFALAPVPAPQHQRAAGAAAVAAIAAAIAATLDPAAIGWRVAALALGAAAAGLHVVLMQRTLKHGMRRDLGRGLLLMRAGWAALGIALALAAAQTFGLGPALGISDQRLTRLIGVCLVVGWLGSFLFGVLQRILPFLASMHCAGAGRRAPVPSALTAERPLQLHLAAHFASLALMAAATLAGSVLLAVLAALIGVAGAAAFAAFFALVLRRMRQAVTAPATTAAPANRAVSAPGSGARTPRAPP